MACQGTSGTGHQQTSVVHATSCRVTGSAPSSPHSLTARVLDTIQRHGLLHGGETVLIAVSGGADSVALLDILRELGSTLGLALAAAHVHHGLRAEAEADADFVRRLCETLAVPFYLERATVRRGPPWDGPEAEARRARYAALEGRALALGAHRIATGHHADDQAETVLMRLLQGAGPRGLAGIAAARGSFIRPLLEARRHEITAHLASRGLAWVEDATNRDSRFLRNRVRHEVLPFLARALGRSVVESLCHSAALCRAAVVDLERQARSELGRVATRGPSGIVFPVEALLVLPEDLAAEMLFLAAADLGETGPRRAAVARAMRRVLLPRSPRRSVTLGRLSVERSGPWLRVGPTRLPAVGARLLRVPGSVDLAEVGFRLEARCLERPPDYRPPGDARHVAFDADHLPAMLVVRSRRAGDRFVPFGGQGERRLKSFLIDARVPRWERSRIPLLEADGDIIWLGGVRRGQRAPVGPGTTHILEATLNPL
jgi:tRNA(Ile)-lysidine synthase